MTVQEAGWSGKENGELLAEGGAHFDVLVTVDQNIRYQQNLNYDPNNLARWSRLGSPPNLTS